MIMIMMDFQSLTRNGSHLEDFAQRLHSIPHLCRHLSDLHAFVLQRTSYLPCIFPSLDQFEYQRFPGFWMKL
jgi:hypothetical protein